MERIRSSEFVFRVLIFPLAILWITTCVAETNRAPFDFAEGERELVSGFNIEYGGGGFALLFLAEYASILAIAIITSVLFFSSGGDLFLALETLIFSFCIV